MNKIYNVYKILKTSKFNPSQIEQLLFLYNSCFKRNQLDKYYTFLNQINPTYETEYLEQLIKCITHDTPYELFLEYHSSIPILNEIRRYLEDSIHKKNTNVENKQYYELAKEFLSRNWSSHLIYQFRRFIKCKKYLSSTRAKYLFCYIEEQKINHWFFLCEFYNIYIETSWNIFLNFLNQTKIKKLIKEYEQEINQENKIQILIEFQILENKYLNKMRDKNENKFK